MKKLDGFTLTKIMALLFLAAVTLTCGCFKMEGDPNNYLGSGFATDPGQTPATSGGLGNSNIPVTPLGPNYQSLNENVFTNKCLGCHNSHVSDGHYDMSGYATLMQGGRVTPFYPETSKLYKIIAKGAMPPKLAPMGDLTADEIQAISDWIKNGALEDGPDATPAPSPSPNPNL